MKIIALSGSLRALSLNTMLLHVIAKTAPPDIEVEIFSRLADIPFFNSDMEENESDAVVALKNKIVAADAVIIASPEYAHGVTGVIKNALDWMVGNESFVLKPVALLNTSPRATHAHASLREIMQVMSAHIVDKASLTLPILGSFTTALEIAHNEKINNLIGVVLAELKQTCIALPNISKAAL